MRRTLWICDSRIGRLGLLDAGFHSIAHRHTKRDASGKVARGERILGICPSQYGCSDPRCAADPPSMPPSQGPRGGAVHKFHECATHRRLIA
jgi:hypothetical protein